jgi:outer membrane protein insertion porin family
MKLSPVDLGVGVGGRFMGLGTAEYMMPVTANEMIKVVGFSDFGTVENDVSLDNFRVSVGAGLRLTIPMMGPVPIALDFAVPVMKQSTDIRQIFSFYIGANW